MNHSSNTLFNRSVAPASAHEAPVLESVTPTMASHFMSDSYEIANDVSVESSSSLPSLSHPPVNPGYLGRHLLAEFFNCNSNVLNNNALIEQYMKEAAVACGATIVQSCFHHFNPYGVSGVVVIAESHLTIHTWPEHGYASVDLYTCGEQCDPAVAFHYLQDKFGSAHCSYVGFQRGVLCQQSGELTKRPAQAMGEPVLEIKTVEYP